MLPPGAAAKYFFSPNYLPRSYLRGAQCRSAMGAEGPTGLATA
jgi:hypothetical protein